MNVLHAVSRLHTMVQGISIQYQLIQSKSSCVQDMPQEIVAMILEYLSVPDQVCFSLSCKHVFACLQSSLKMNGMQLSQLLPPEKRPILCPDSKKRPLVQLLRQLENSRWKYCSECWSLHPHSTWRALKSTRKLRQKPYCFNCHLIHAQICYMPYAGVVDLCPCLTITFRDKLQIMETCMYARQSALEGCHYYYNDVLSHPSYGKLHKYLWHECTFSDHPFAKVRISTSLSIDEETIGLSVLNRYAFEILQESPSSRASSSSIVKTPSVCRHREPGTWLERFFDEAGSSFRGWDKTHTLCPTRQTDWGDWKKPEAGHMPCSFEIVIVRNLGNKEWPNKDWDHYCRR